MAVKGVPFPKNLYNVTLPKLFDFNEIASTIPGYKATSFNYGPIFLVTIYFLDSIHDMGFQYDLWMVPVFLIDTFPQLIINRWMDALYEVWTTHVSQVDSCFQIDVYKLCGPTDWKL